MKLYCTLYKGELSNYEWVIVTIHKTMTGANKEYKQLVSEIRGTERYCIHILDTDVEYDVIYDCDKVNEIINDDEFND